MLKHLLMTGGKHMLQKAKDFIIKRKKKKIFYIAILVAVIGTFFLLNQGVNNEKENSLHSLGSRTQTPETIAAWKEAVGTPYYDFNEEQEEAGKKAAELAEEFYLNEHGELRDTSYFYAETEKDGLFIVAGIDSFDGRDQRFATYQVNLEEQEIIDLLVSQEE
jgi:hypothetical protein